ncbi:type II secretion system F family protein [Flexibacterium corallicola]|uniref:type II secretion system F family protein n=1 Tax=Flexibacterium corallicola TaxID=3037259 RepID=UPI00286EBEA4|nr:type II secretion system F family protein [Pseudovibrio sp. M1P-2-3]
MNNIELKFIQLQFKLSKGKQNDLLMQILQFLDAGMTITKALDNIYLCESFDGKKPKAIGAVAAKEWSRVIKNGLGLGEALAGWIPESNRVIISAGDAAGNPPKAIKSYLRVSAAGSKISSALWGSLGYPIFLFSFAILFLIYTSKKIIPTFSDMLPIEQWPSVPHSLATVSGFLDNNIISGIILLVLLVFAIIWSLPRWTGRVRQYVDYIPPYSLYRIIVGSGFLMSFSSMMSTGMPAPKILPTLLRTASPWYAERLQQIKYQNDNGNNIGKSLYKSGYVFPTMRAVMNLRAYSELKNFDRIVEELADQWLDENISTFAKVAKILSILALSSFAMIVLWIFLSMQILTTHLSSSM